MAKQLCILRANKLYDFESTSLSLLSKRSMFYGGVSDILSFKAKHLIIFYFKVICIDNIVKPVDKSFQ